RDFPDVALQPVSLLVEMDRDVVEGDRLGRLFDYSERLRRVPEVARVESLLSYAGVKDREGAEELAPILYARQGAAGDGVRPGLRAILPGRYALVRVVSTVPPDSAPGQAQVMALRAVAPPEGGRVLVFGQAATLYDFVRRLEARAPLMLALVL